MKLLVQGGHVIDPANGIDQNADVAIENGIVLAVGKTPAGFKADQTIDARNRIVCPGFVDLRARLREPGQEHKATIASETTAAAAGGITTLCLPPDTNPVIDTPAVAELIYQRAAAVRKARVVCIGALTTDLGGQQISEMKALSDAGCVGVGNGLEPVSNTLVMRRAMEYAASNNMTIFLYSEDPYLRENGVAHEGAISTRLGLAGIPEMAETIAVARDLALVEQAGVRAHFGPLSSARAVKAIGRARYDGLPVTADVSIYHLHLTEMDLSDFDAQSHVRPPLRTQRDRDGLREAIANGTLSAITTDHQPHDIDAKLGPINQSEPGISGLETLLPLALRLVDDKVASLSQIIACMSQKPADILGLPVGRLSVGAPADICIFDPEVQWQIEPEKFISQGKNTPFAGWNVQGQVMMTLLDGQIVFQRN